MYPYYLTFQSDTFLIELSDGRFQLMGAREIEPVLIGHKYILIEKEIADKFIDLGADRFTTESVIIWNRQEDIEYFGHVKMMVNHHFEADQINDIDLDGKQFLLMENKYLFVSPELKSVLETQFPKFEFTEGLSHFA